MALDGANHRLFVATHEPARLAVLDTAKGHSVAVLPCVQDADDVCYDSGRKRIYVPGGEGFISVFEQVDPDHYIPPRRSPLRWVPTLPDTFAREEQGFDRFFLAVPARADHGSETWIHTVQD